MTLPNLADLEKIQYLTKEYSQYSRTRLGLAYMFLAILLVGLYFLARQMNPNLVSAIAGGCLTAISILLWLAARNWLVENLYQGFGVARATMPIFQREFLLGLGMGLLFSIVLFGFVQQLGTWFQIPNTFVVALPAIVVGLVSGWQQSRNAGSNFGFSVMVIGAFIGGGINWNASNLSDIQRSIQLAFLVIVPLIFIAIGIREHFQFQQLEQQLQALKSKGIL